jgi:hypothetical protein
VSLQSENNLLFFSVIWAPFPAVATHHASSVVQTRAPSGAQAFQKKSRIPFVGPAKINTNTGQVSDSGKTLHF